MHRCDTSRCDEKERFGHFCRNVGLVVVTARFVMSDAMNSVEKVARQRFHVSHPFTCGVATVKVPWLCMHPIAKPVHDMGPYQTASSDKSSERYMLGSTCYDQQQIAVPCPDTVLPALLPAVGAVARSARRLARARSAKACTGSHWHR